MLSSRPITDTFVSNDDFMRSYIKPQNLDNITEGNYDEEDEGNGDDDVVMALNSPGLKINNFMSIVGDKSLLNTSLPPPPIKTWTDSDL